jgi:two-component system, NarL family, sensor kinase
MQNGLSEVVIILAGSTFIVILLTGVIVFALFVSQKRKFIYHQELIEMKYANEQEILRTQIETQVQTFQTISQELHDNVGTLMSIAIVHLKSVEDGAIGKQTNTKNITESVKLIEEGLDILRDISRSINPDIISKQGLDQSFRIELERLRKTRMFETSYASSGDEFLIPPQHQMVILRIFQETLNNILKHSGGDRVIVSAHFQNPVLKISTRDNGKGFNMTGYQQMSSTRSGIHNMQKRAKIIDASLFIISNEGKGTTVEMIYNAPKG